LTVGAYDHVTKPFSVDEVKLLLERVASDLTLKSENRMLREKVDLNKDPAASAALSKFRSSTP